MPPDAALGVRGYVLRNRGLIFPVLVVASVLVLLAPLPPLVLDLLLASNVTVAVVILLTTIYVERPLDFSVFPALLLGTTLSRLVLNVASTRLILTRGGTEGTQAAGGVIEAFGHFVSGDSVVVGLIIFAILVTIQFLVITKGATRISEVAARFALDGMPGKQMAIDADLSAGLITQEEAKLRRQEVADQADFYGAMDGAGKFVRGDAVAGMVITLINIAGGLFLGMIEHGMAFAEAVRVFTTLTIGDGLVTQVPAFLISLAAGLIVTRNSSRSNLPREAVGQLFRHPEALILAGLFLAILAATGLPALPLLSMSLICGAIGWNLLRDRRATGAIPPQQTAGVPQRPEPQAEDFLAVDPLELELGVGLICLADPARGGDLLERVTHARQAIARELGIILPRIRIRDNVRLEQRHYQIKIRGVAVAEAAVDPEVRLEASAIVIAHLTEVVREHAADLLTRQQVHQLLDNLRRTSPKAVDELIPDVLKTAQVHQVLENLLRERVPIRDLETILETLGNHADQTSDLNVLTEHVRTGLSRTICHQHRDRRRVLHVVTLDPLLEEELAAAFSASERGTGALSAVVVEALIRAFGNALEQATNAGHPPVVLCSPPIRAGLRQLTRSRLPKLAILSTSEITRDTEVKSVGQVEIEAFGVAA